MNIQFLLSFKNKKGDSTKSKIRTFYSLRKHGESRQVISAIMKKLQGKFPQFEWKISGFSDLLFNLKHLGVYLSFQPTIFMEIDNFKLEEQDVLQDLMEQVFIMLKGDSAPSLKNKGSQSNKPQLPSGKVRKKQIKKTNPLLPPPEGPVFRFVPLAEGGRAYPFLAPQHQDEKVNVYQAKSCVEKQKKTELNLLEELKKWS